MKTLEIAETGPWSEAAITVFSAFVFCAVALPVLSIYLWRARTKSEDPARYLDPPQRKFAATAAVVSGFVVVILPLGILVTPGSTDARYHQERAVTGVVDKVEEAPEDVAPDRSVVTMDDVLFVLDETAYVKAIKVGDKVQLRCVEQATGYYEGAYKCTLEGKP